MSARSHSISSTKEFADLTAAIDRNVSSDTAAELLAAFYNVARAEVQREVRAEIAADFVRQGKASVSLTWGQAHEIALNGLCSCSGGVKPCDMAREKTSAPAPAATPEPAATPSDCEELTKIGPARSIYVEPISDGLCLDLVATRDEWKLWADALDVDAARTTHRGGYLTSHATWRGHHIAIRCHYSGGDR